MTLGRWTIRRPRSTEVRYGHKPLSRGLVIEWQSPEDARVTSLPVPKEGWVWAWPWILYRSIKAVRELRGAFWIKEWQRV